MTAVLRWPMAVTLFAILVEGRASAAGPRAKPKVLSKDPAGCVWIESDAAITASEFESRQQARAGAVAQARQTALTDFFGVEAKTDAFDFNQQGLRGSAGLVDKLLTTTRNGRILNEKIVREGYQDGPGCRDCRYYVKLRSCVTAAPETRDREFQVELGLNRSRFVEGDEAKLEITATRDCYLYVYDVGTEGQTTLLVPYPGADRGMLEARVKAGQPWTFPPLGRSGSSLRASLPTKMAQVSAEVIRVIAVKSPLPSKVYEPGADGYLGVLRSLNAARLEWAEDAQAFMIYRH